MPGLINRCALLLPALSAIVLGTPGNQVVAAEQAPASVEPAAAVPEEKPPEDFKLPRSKDLKFPGTPLSERNRGNSGWVILIFMVDTAGKPYEIVATDSGGGEVFERAAVEATAASLFEPALLNGMPVEGRMSTKTGFNVFTDDYSGASLPFTRAYKRLNRGIAARDRAAAEAALADLNAKHGRNLYDSTLVYLGWYNYYFVWGDKQQQHQALARAIAGDPTYLPTELSSAAQLALLQLQLELRHFAAARVTWNILQRTAVDPAVRAKWQAVIDNVDKLRKAPQKFSVDGRIDTRSWFHLMFTRRFQINVVSGRVSGIKMRCDRQYVFYAYEANTEYKLDPAAGECNMEVLGEPGTRFELIQS